MSKAASILSLHSADTAGVCSMLYELGGLVVVHDASGCNSTYATHDEPRWGRIPSHIFISALTEQDAILGNDDKFIDNVAETAAALHPRFIAICGSPIPMLVGTDYDALAAILQKRCGITAFAIRTNGMHSYLVGASDALAALLRHYATERHPRPGTPVNLLGVTPLDYARDDTMRQLHRWAAANGLDIVASLCRECTLDDLARAGDAAVNLVLSTTGLAAARLLQERFGQPYVVGAPFGVRFAAEVADAIRAAAAPGESRLPPAAPRPVSGAAFIGEAVTAASLACALGRDFGAPARVLCPLEETPRELLAPGDALLTPDEEALRPLLADATVLYADPMYIPVATTGIPFYAIPSFAFSGRCYFYRDDFPQLIAAPLDLQPATDRTTTPRPPC